MYTAGRRGRAAPHDAGADHAHAGEHAAGADHGFGRHPHAVLEGDRLAEEAEQRVVPVVVAGEQVGALADANVRTDRHRGVIVDPHAFAEPDVVADLQKPRILDGDARLDHQAVADAGAKGAQHSRLPARRQDQGTLEDERARHVPGDPPGDAAVARDDRLGVAGEVDAGDTAARGGPARHSAATGCGSARAGAGRAAARRQRVQASRLAFLGQAS